MLPFILSIVAGFGSRFVKEALVGALEQVLLDKVEIKTEDALALSYAVCLLGAAIIIALSSASISPITVVLGGLLGLFGTEIVTAIRKQIG